MPRFSLSAAAFSDTGAVCADLHARVQALDTDASDAAVRPFLHALQAHGLLVLDPGDAVPTLCNAVRRGLALEPTLTAAANPFRHCFDEAVRAVLGATFLSEYHLRSPAYSKPRVDMLVASPASVHMGVQLRIVTGVCRLLARQGVVSPRDAASLGVHLFQCVRGNACKVFVFEHDAYDDFSATESALHVLAHSIAGYKDAKPALAPLLVRVFLGLHRFVDAQFRSWLPTAATDLVDAYYDKLLAHVCAQEVYDMLFLCIGPHNPPPRVSPHNVGKYDRLLDVLYPGGLEHAFVPPSRRDTRPAPAAPDSFAIPEAAPAPAGPPVSVLIQAMVGWDLLFTAGTAVSSQLQHAVAAEYVCRIVMAVRGHGTFLECLV